MSKYFGPIGMDLSAYATGEPKSGVKEMLKESLSGIGNDIVDKGRSLLSSVVSGASDVINAALPTATAALAQLSYSGSVGNFTSAQEDIQLTAKFQLISEMAPEKRGSPCYRNLVINTLSGFVMCENPVFRSAIATSVEESAVEAFMTGGFFYE
jgi:hypothetical protein